MLESDRSPLVEQPLGAEPSEYVRSVVYRDETWRADAMCRGASTEVVTMFTCTEDERFVVLGRQVWGYDVQCYLVEAYCEPCPVQWECARHGVEVEELEDRSTGAWAMTRRDRRWLAKQPDAFKIIDQAKFDDVPVHVAVAAARHRTD